jgi:carbamoyl-phosphate synthase large subunit/carbamoyl-phosphate synthase small subunit
MAEEQSNKNTSSPSPPSRKGSLVLQDGTTFEGISFGYPTSVAGEVVFNTGMVGYPESLTDPSYTGQILNLTYPLIGNYGVPAPEPNDPLHLQSRFESERIRLQGLLVSDYTEAYSHWEGTRSLGQWLYDNKVPALTQIDTRQLTKKLRERGSMLGKIIFDNEELDFYDPDMDNLVAQSSITEKVTYGQGGTKRIVLVDCGCKHNIVHSLLERGVEVVRVPWDYDFHQEPMDGLFISNGPGNPKTCKQAVLHIRRALARRIPIFGICMGHQLLALAAGANTFKLKYGHRSQNQPVREEGTHRCLITSQNHSFAVDSETIPNDWEPWFTNLNDQTNEGIRHKSSPFMSVQFHPEAMPGPFDAGFLFDRFVNLVNEYGPADTKRS